jgi:hypothetical protein
MVWESSVNFNGEGTFFVSSKNWSVSYNLSSFKNFFSTSGEGSFNLYWVNDIGVIEVSSMVLLPTVKMDKYTMLETSITPMSLTQYKLKLPSPEVEKKFLKLLKL